MEAVRDMMSNDADFGNSSETIIALARELESYVQGAATEGTRQYDVERGTLRRVLQIGKRAMDLYLSMQGTGDLGPSITPESGVELFRSDEPASRRLRTIFGEHQFSSYVYAAGPKQAIALRPMDARLQLPAGTFSYLFEEFSQYFCVEQSFSSAAQRWDAMFGQKTSVDSLERISQRMGAQASAFLESLPTPPADQEGEVLVVTADGKGVPLVKRDAERVPAFEQRERPGNRRMATLGGVYTVDRHVRTPERILAALFREEPTTPTEPRPEPKAKHLRGCFTKPLDEEEVVCGAIQTFAWLREQVEKRHKPGQPIVLLMDGQASLWDAAQTCLEDLPDSKLIEILDIVHVASYVWRAAKVFESTMEHREAFVWDRLERILSGQTKNVIAGLRRMAALRNLSGPRRREIETVCGYFTNNLERMAYNEYLRAGYPIASGVIEGACRHLVKDRLERSGMRWTLNGAQAMLDVRAVLASSFWNDFHQRRMASEQQRLHPHAHLIDRLKPKPLTC